MEDIRILFTHGMETAQVKEMVTLVKQQFVLSHHTRAITHLAPSNTWKDGCYKTYVYVDNKRKEIIAKTEEKLFDKLYDFYYEADIKTNSLECIFEQLMDYKANCLNKRDRTIITERNRFKHVPKTFVRNTSVILLMKISVDSSSTICFP